ncbi:MAG: RIP metalloprotease RseP, partial [Pseudomonadota bacterium]|nr:RIP metalloprotease RseP [Pseudomonadota bacterium]
MSDFFGSIWWLIVSIGVLVTFHEFGHFWVARRFGVKVLRFSVGFGKALWSRRGKDGTEYVIAAIPLGGYVKFLDEREGEVAPDDADRAFNRQSVWQRIAIVAAGPVANLLLCIALLWGMFVVGRPDYAPSLGRVEGIAAQAGFRTGDTLLKVGARETPTWSEAALALTTAAMDRQPVEVQVRSADGDRVTRTLPLARLPANFEDARAVQVMGLSPRHYTLPAVIGAVEPGTAADGILAVGDRITAIDGRKVATYDDIGPLVQIIGRQDSPAMVEVERGGERLALELRPSQRSEPGRGTYWALGITPKPPTQAPAYDALLRHGPLAAIPAALRETATMFRDSVAMIGRMFSGRASASNVSGPITIARYANASAQLGPAWFLNFLALLSLSLAIINLLPIPVLDGGHLLYYLIELVKGSPLSERAMAAGQFVGLALLASLMGLAFYND